MEILNPLTTASNAQTAFTIQPGKQITLHAKGLAGDDKVFIEILELSKAPDFTGNPCCTFYRTDIQVLARTPLLCGDGRPATLTADYPVGTLDAPQSVTLGVRVDADDAAVVSIELYETDSDGCMACICDRPPEPCQDTDWLPTGVERCVADNVERQEESNCGNKRWVVDRPQIWVETGNTRCKDFKEEVEEVNDCGKTRWTATTKTCGYCPSLRIACDGSVGFGYHEADPKDPAATVEMAPCPGDTSADSIWIYPSAGPGHTVKVTDCDGNLIGYAVNKSDCAPDCGCAAPEIKVNVAAPKVEVTAVNNFKPVNNVAAPQVDVTAINNFAPTTNVEAPTVVMPPAKLVALQLTNDGKVVATNSDGTTVTSNPLPSC